MVELLEFVCRCIEEDWAWGVCELEQLRGVLPRAAAERLDADEVLRRVAELLREVSR